MQMKKLAVSLVATIGFALCVFFLMQFFSERADSTKAPAPRDWPATWPPPRSTQTGEGPLMQGAHESGPEAKTGADSRRRSQRWRQHKRMAGAEANPDLELEPALELAPAPEIVASELTQMTEPVAEEQNQTLVVATEVVDSVPDTNPPPLSVISPADRSYVLTGQIFVRVQSEAGVKVSINGKMVFEDSPGLFLDKVSLRQGMNRLPILAKDGAGNMARTALRVTYINASKYRRFKDRLTVLLRQLDEVRGASDDMYLRLKKLIHKISNTEDAKRIIQLSIEKDHLQHARKELEQEVEKFIDDINRILTE